MGTMAVTSLTMSSGVGTFVNDLSTYADGSTQHTITGITDTGKLLVIAKNTAASSATLTIKGGDFHPNKGVGDLAVNLMQNDVVGVPLEGARFLNDDGTIEFTVSSGATGDISAIQTP